MNRKKTIGIISVAVVALALAVGSFTYQSVNAQASTPTPSTPPQTQMGKGPLGADLRGATDEGLATALGISVDELQTAKETAQANALKAAVDQGLLTQAQADALANKAGARFHGGFGLGWLEQNGINFDQYLADALGISTDDLQAARDKAFNTNLDAAVADGSITQEQADLIRGRKALYGSSTFQTSMQSAFEAAVNQAVADGVITQAQADQIIQNDASQFAFPRMHGMDGFGGHHGGRGMGGGRGAGFSGGNVQPSEEVTPSSDL